MGFRGLRHIRAAFPQQQRQGAARTLVIGAGEAGALALQEMKQHAHLCLEPVAIVDDDKDKHGKKLFGVPVVGDRNSIHQVVERFRIDQIVIAIPSASEKDINEIISICKRTKCKLKTLPGVFELLNGNVTVNQIRDVQIEDLLGRKPVKLDIHNIKGFISNKTILVTGGGGSIGSELCRQIARLSPAKLLILDIYENGAYDLQMETTRKIPGFRYGSFNCICS
ncbi:MAG: polysaccharide biosynthesis protein [Clostridia bacterium]